MSETDIQMKCEYGKHYYSSPYPATNKGYITKCQCGKITVSVSPYICLTKRAADSPKAGGKSAKRKVVKAKVTRPAKSG